MEINAEQSKGKKVFPEFIEQIHVANLQPIQGLPIYRGWDFGFHNPCCVWSQINPDDQWCLLWELLGHDEALEIFAPKVKSYFQGFQFKDFADRAGAQSSDKSQRTSIQILNSFGITPQYKFSNPEDRAQLIRGKLLKRLDNKPGILVNKTCRMIIDGMNGGYHYPEITTRSPNEKEEPVKDGIFEHYFDCIGYQAIFLFKPNKMRRDAPIRPRRTVRYNRFTGCILR
jgi:hypothetical protein